MKALTGQGQVELAKKAMGTNEPKGIVTPVTSAYGPTSFEEPIHLNRAAVKMDDRFYSIAQDAHQETEKVEDPVDPVTPRTTDPEASLSPDTKKALEAFRAKERERIRVENLRKALTSGN